jgi:hypothetical protein
MRRALISFIAVLGCAAAVGASPKSVDNALPMPGTDKAATEAALNPVVPLAQLLDEFPDGAHVIRTYQAVRTVSDVETANAQVKAQISKAYSVASDIARLHAAAIRSCQGTEPSQIDAIALKAKALSATLARVDDELTKSLVAMRQKVEVERPTSIRAREDVNRLSLATHEIGRLRLQAQEVAKTIESFGMSLQKLTASCTTMLVPPLFAERVVPASVALPKRRPTRQATKTEQTSAAAQPATGVTGPKSDDLHPAVRLEARPAQDCPPLVGAHNWAKACRNGFVWIRFGVASKLLPKIRGSECQP